MYLPVVARGFAFNERLSLDGNPSISAGDIEIHNEDGALDSWLSDVWVNRAIRVYIGDVTWPRADFRLEFSGVVADLVSSSADRLNIVLRNKLERLNTPVSESTLGGVTSNKDRLLPVLLGECHNVEPLLIDPANHEYMVHNGPMERLIEVRDNGVPLSNLTATLGAGKFRLGNTPAGTITVSAQGRTPYSNTVAALVQMLATQYGTPTERLMAGDLDAASLAAFAAAHPQPVGLSLPDRANVLQCCQQLAASVGAQVVMSRQGLLRLVRSRCPVLDRPQQSALQTMRPARCRSSSAPKSWPASSWATAATGLRRPALIPASRPRTKTCSPRSGSRSRRAMRPRPALTACMPSPRRQTRCCCARPTLRPKPPGAWRCGVCRTPSMGCAAMPSCSRWSWVSPSRSRQSAGAWKPAGRALSLDCSGTGLQGAVKWRS